MNDCFGLQRKMSADELNKIVDKCRQTSISPSPFKCGDIPIDEASSLFLLNPELSTIHPKPETRNIVSYLPLQTPPLPPFLLPRDATLSSILLRADIFETIVTSASLVSFEAFSALAPNPKTYTIHPCP